MSTLLIVLFLIVALVIVASIALGRSSYEVESARDTEYLDLDGNWVRYNVTGGGPPVVLVHGWLSSSRVWDELAGRLAQRFTVYTLDLSGFGESDKPLSGYGVRYGSRLLYAFCAHFGLTRVNIIGHDIGGNMAVKLAADHPDMVGRIALVAVPANEEQIDLPTLLWLATLPVIGPLFYMLGRALRPLRVMWMRPFVYEPDDLPEETVDDAAMSTPAAISKSLSVTRREISGGRLARQARILKIPMFLISGEEDQIVDPQAIGVWARASEQAGVALLNDCGHLPMIERTAEFNAQILAFLTGDARYLDYVQPRAAQSEDEEDERYAEEPYADEPDASYEELDESEAPEPYDAGHQGDEFPEPRIDQEETGEEITREVPRRSPDPQHEETRPNVARRRGDVYPAREHAGPEDNDVDSGASGNGTEGHARPERSARDIFERGTGPEEKGSIPELPEDLFSWPEPRERRSSERYTENPPDEDSGYGNQQDEPEERPER